MNRRGFWRIGAALGAVALTPVLDCYPAAAAGPAAREVPLRGGWRCTGTSGQVTVPHTVVRQSWREWDPAGWERIWRYDTVFDLPPTGRCRYLLRFDGALTAATPTVNGQSFDRHVGGYLPFEYEITGAVRQRGNALSVQVDGRFDIDVPPNRPGEASDAVDYWQPAGLYREVTVLAVPQVYLSDVFAVGRAVLDPGARRLDVRVTVDAAVAVNDAAVRFSLLDGPVVVATATVPVSVAAQQVSTVTTRLGGLSAARLWDIDDPHMYRLRAELLVSGAPVHEYWVPVGFRQAEFRTDGFFLNGKKRTLFGLNRHQFFPYVGAAMPPRVQRRDAQILKDLNCSMVRCSHYPQHTAFLDACDELGILVYSEAPGWGYLGDAQWQEHVVRDVRDMITRDRNHPSIVLWGVRLNETPGNAALYTRTQQLARELDDSRQTTGAIIGPDYATTDFQQDVFSYNDYDAVQVGDVRLPQLRPPRPEYPFLVTESVGTLSGPATFYRRTEPVAAQHGQALAHALVHEQAAADPRYCGALGWCGFDYPSGTGNQYQGVKYPGVIDEFRVPKLGAAVYAAQVDPARRVVIEPAFYWDLDGEFSVRGLGSDALIFANADRLVLRVDGREFATLAPDTDRFGHLPYPPFSADFSTLSGGTILQIDAFRGLLRIGSRQYSADRSGDRLSAVADDAAITADGVDATRVVLRLVDSHGAQAPPRDGAVRMAVSGPAELVGDNPFPLGDTGGVAAVWLRGTGTPGTVRLRAEHDTAGSAEVVVSIGTAAERGV